MCGIHGWLQSVVLRDNIYLEAMAQITSHRGPDDRGRYFDDAAGLALGHNRLSIIDLSAAGHQPMFNEDRSVAIVFNGEIYNFQSLRSELIAAGHRFVSKTDTEVLVHGYEQWGTSLLDRLAGMFAFAIWDEKKQSLFLARDPMGIKPLYYWRDASGGFVFASELKAFLAIPGFVPRLNRAAITQFLEFNFIHDPQFCSLEGVSKLPPGHLMTVERGQPPQIRRYFVPPAVESCPDDPASIDSRVERLFETFSEAVGQHLIADVPVGLLLSGGLDSSLIAAVASKHQKLNTLSFAFGDSQIDERPFARLVSDHLGTQHQEIVIQPSDVTTDLQQSVWYFDDLFGDWGLISTRILYQQCRDRGLKVVLVGEGSDELFGGYRSYELTRGKRGLLPLSLQLYRWYSGRRWGHEWLPFHNLLNQLRRETDTDDFSAVRLFETRHQLPNNYNMKVDKASMASSVEARVPFLDVRVAREGYQTPQNLLHRDGTNKWILRRMSEKYKLLPPEITYRKKFGASIASSWMDESPKFRNFARDAILDSAGVTAEFGLERAMRAYFERGRSGFGHHSGISIFSIVAWRLLLLNVWYREIRSRSSSQQTASPSHHFEVVN